MRVGNGKKPVSNTSNKVSSGILEEKINSGEKKVKDNGYISMDEQNSVKRKPKKEFKSIAETIAEQQKDEENKRIEDERLASEEEENKKNKGKKSKKGKKKKNKKPKKIYDPARMKRMSGGRITAMVLVGILSATGLVGGTYGLYMNQIKYPRQMSIDLETSGLGGITRFMEAVNTLDNAQIKGITGQDSFLAKEVEYTNGNVNKQNFIKKALSTVSYEPEQVIALNKYGNTMMDWDDNVVYTDSLVTSENEEVVLHYIDYKSLTIDEEKLKALMKEENLKLGDVDYSNKLVEVFCKYMSSLNTKDIPVVNDKRVPNLVKIGDRYEMSADEDIYLDKKLFSSEDFYDFLDRFSAVAGGGGENTEWVKWDKLDEEEKKDKKEPDKVLKELEPRTEWVQWSAKSEEEKKKELEPEKYDPKQVISKVWCGSYYLLNEHEIVDENGNKVKQAISAMVGDGSFENPSGMNTQLVTSVFVEENGKRVAKPIRIELIDYRVSEEAIKYFESKDERNRGIDVTSEVQYCSYSFRITNLSGAKLSIKDNSSLADSSANMAPRTGTMYGMVDELTLNPDESGVIESWGSSTELNKKYVVWGEDFQREEPVIWFRLLMGNLEDKSEDKGVTLNKSREEEKEEEKPVVPEEGTSTSKSE